MNDGIADAGGGVLVGGGALEGAPPSAAARSASPIVTTNDDMAFGTRPGDGRLSAHGSGLTLYCASVVPRASVSAATFPFLATLACLAALAPVACGRTT